MATVKTKTTEIGSFVFRREEERLEYVCDRCLRPKTTRIRVKWTDRNDVKRHICNGCYGRLLAKPHEA